MKQRRNQSREGVMEWLAEARAKRIGELRERLEEKIPIGRRTLLELGCGHGHWLAAYGEKHPEIECVGVDLRSRRIRLAGEKVRKRGLTNVHFLKGEAVELLEATPEGIGWELVCLYFLDPWPKAKHHKKRLVQPEFLSFLHGKTNRGARLYFRTDHRRFYEWTRKHLESAPGWTIDPSGEWLFEHGSHYQEMMNNWHSLIGLREDRAD